MTLRRKYELKRRMALLWGEFETPGRYRKLTEDEITAEWSSPRKQILRTQSLTNLQSRGTDATGRTETSRTGEMTIGGATVSLGYSSAPLRTPRLGFSVNDSRRRHTTAVTLPVEFNTDAIGSNSPTGKYDTNTRNSSSTSSKENDDIDKRDMNLHEQILTIPSQNTKTAPSDFNSRPGSGDSLLESGSGKNKVNDGKVGHCLTCKCSEFGFPTRADASCQTRKHSKKRSTDASKKQNECDTKEQSNGSADTTSVNSQTSSSDSSSSSSSTTADDKPYKEILILQTSFPNSPADTASWKEQQTPQISVDLPEADPCHQMDDTKCQGSARHVPLKGVSTGAKLGFSVVNKFSYVEIPKLVWMDNATDAPYVCLDEIRKDAVPELTSTPRDDSMSGMATCVDDNTVSSYTEMNGETSDDPTTIKSSIPNTNVPTLPIGELGHAEIRPEIGIDVKETGNVPDHSSSCSSSVKEKDAEGTSSSSNDSVDSSTYADASTIVDDNKDKDAIKQVTDTKGNCANDIKMKPPYLNVSTEVQESVIDMSSESENMLLDGNDVPVDSGTEGEGAAGGATVSDTSGLDGCFGSNTSNVYTAELNLSGDMLDFTKGEKSNIVVTITAASSDNTESDSCSETVVFQSATDINLSDQPLKQAKVYVPSDDTDTSTESDDDSKQKNIKMNEKPSVPVNGICVSNQNVVKPDTDIPSTSVIELNLSSHSNDMSTSDSYDTTRRTLSTSADEPSVCDLPKDNNFEGTVEITKPENKVSLLTNGDMKADMPHMTCNGFDTIVDTNIGVKPCTDDTTHIDSIVSKPEILASDYSIDVSPNYKEQLPDSHHKECLPGSGQNELPCVSHQVDLSAPGGKTELPSYTGRVELLTPAQADLSFDVDKKEPPMVTDQQKLSLVIDNKNVSPVSDTKHDSSVIGHDDGINIGDIYTQPRGETDNESKADQVKEKILDTSSSSDDKSGKDKNTSHTSSTSDGDGHETPKSKHNKSRMSLLNKIKQKIFSDGENQNHNANADVMCSKKCTPTSQSPVKPKRRFKNKSDKKEKRKKKSSTSESVSDGDKNTDKEMIEIDASIELDKLEKSKDDDDLKDDDDGKLNAELIVEHATDIPTKSTPTELNVSSLKSDSCTKDVLPSDADSALRSADKAHGVIYITNNAEGSLPLESNTDDISGHDIKITQAVDKSCDSTNKENVITAQSKQQKSNKKSKESKHKGKSPKKGLFKSLSKRSSSSSDGVHDKSKDNRAGEDNLRDNQQPVCVSQSLHLATSPSVDIQPSSSTFNSSSSSVSPSFIVHSSNDHETDQGSLYTECIPLEAVSVPSSVSPKQHSYFVVVAIDFGTTYSGYALSFTRDPDNVHMMRNWEGGDPGVVNQKIPTSILLTPEGDFDSFGFTARDRYHNLEQSEAKKWLYFEKFKMILHHSSCSDDWKILRNNLFGKQMQLTKDTQLYASNGQAFPALTIFSYALRFFKEHALEQLSDQCGTAMLNGDVRWVITVPAIWKAPAKQFMRQAAYDAGMVSPGTPDQMLIALEPEAASIYCRKLRMYELVPESPVQRPLQSPRKSVQEPLNMTSVCTDMGEDLSPLRLPFDLAPHHVLETKMKGTRYLVVDCGGGTVDITVHELDDAGKLKELYKATGGPYGSLGIDIEFEKLLYAIFGEDFIDHYKAKYPVGWVNLMINFESRKRSASPYKSSPLNISVPFSFIDFHKKQKTGHIESAVKKYGDSDITWSSEGMLRLSPMAMKRLFLPTIERIKQTIGDVLNNKEARDLSYMFLVGGFAESPILQQEIRREFSHILKILIPAGVSLAILKGAVLFGLDPTVVNVRRSRLTYGVGVLNRFDPNKHPNIKLVTREGKDWCTDVFEKYVIIDEAVTLGDTVVRSYTPAKSTQQVSIINIYSSESPDSNFITDPGVRKCGTLCLDVSDMQAGQLPARREIQTRMMFGDTEIKVSALDVTTGRCVKANIDFLNK